MLGHGSVFYSFSWLDSTSHVAIHLFTGSSVNKDLGCLHLIDVVTKCSYIYIQVQVFTSFGYIPGHEIALCGCLVHQNVSHSGRTISHFPPQTPRVPTFLHLLNTPFLLLSLVISVGVEYLTVALICNSTLIHDAEPLSKCLWSIHHLCRLPILASMWPRVPSTKNKNPVPSFKWICYSWVESVPYIVILIDLWFAKVLPLICI